MSKRYETVSFLSDYGLADEFVGVVHSVIAGISPTTRVIDVTHQIPPHNVRAGGLALARSAPYLCPGVVLAVVDPGVGGSRRAVAVEVGDGASVLVGPDNGLLGPAVALVGGATRAVELTNTTYQLEQSPEHGITFAGRDVFAPAAAHLSEGVELGELGNEIDTASLTPATMPVSQMDGDDLVAEVLWVDRFGNCQLNLAMDDLVVFGAVIQLSMDDDIRTAEVASTYDDIDVGKIGLVVDSVGLVSLAMCRRSAAVELGIGEGTEVRIRPAEGGSAGTVTQVELGKR